MPTDVIMPQMGESIFDGTITKWLKKAGDAVQKDEPLFEISTDKVDAEIPSPVTGVLAEIRVSEGTTVPVNAVVAVLTEPGEAAAPSKADRPSSPQAAQPKAADAPTAEARPAIESRQAGAGTEVVMPQMGESIFEGTITRWLKKTGETVQKDEPLFEISTDKVDAEIPAPAAGVLSEIRVPEGATVQVNAVVAVIGGAAPVAQPEGGQSAEAAKSAATTEARASAPPSPASQPGPAAPAEPGPSIENEKIRSSPLVRRMAREHKLDLRRIRGTAGSGRICKEDVLRYLAEGEPASAPPSATPAQQTAPAQLADGLVPMTRMRSIIAQRMVESRHTSPHAYTVYKIDMTRVVRLREREKAGFEKRHGVKLTYMPFIATAVVEGLRRFPILNASLENGSIRYHGNINLGIAVALEWGLIVPVVARAEKGSFVGIARAIADLAERARTKKLKPEEAFGSTFTLTNSGVFGGEFGTPIINQPESAILAIGGLRKEPVVLSDREGDTIAIRSMQSMCLGFDHRLIDGADAGRFMLDVQKTLESWDRELG